MGEQFGVPPKGNDDYVGESSGGEGPKAWLKERGLRDQPSPLISVPVTLLGFFSLPSPPADPIAARLKEVRLQRDDFEILKVIGRGAFSEVSTEWRNSALFGVGGVSGLGAGP
jgi:hypothetical protein